MPGDARMKDPVKIEAKKKEQATAEWRKRSVKLVRNVVLCVVLSFDKEAPVVIEGGVTKGSQERLFRHLDMALRPADWPEDEPVHTLCGHGILNFDLKLLALHALKHGYPALARMLMPRSKWSSSAQHLDTLTYYDDRLCNAALHYGHVHPSPDGGKHVADWVESGRSDLAIEHCIDDVLAQNVIAWPLVESGIAKIQR